MTISMFDIAGVGTDWIEIKRQKDEAAAQAGHEAGIAIAKRGLEMGLSPEDIAELTDLPIEEVKALIQHS